MTSRHRSFLELDESVERMKEFDILESPCLFCYPECLPEVELLANIDRVDDLRWIPAIGHPVFDCCQIAREIESCSILFLEDTRWYLGVLWEYDPDTPIFILSCYSLLYQFSHDIFHSEL